MEENFTITTLEHLPNTDIEAHMGLVSGSAIMKVGGIRALKILFKNFFSGEVNELNNIFNETRSKAIEEMKSEAIRLGANTVINTRFESVRLDNNYCEVHVYGSAVKANSF